MGSNSANGRSGATSAPHLPHSLVLMGMTLSLPHAEDGEEATLHAKISSTFSNVNVSVGALHCGLAAMALLIVLAAAALPMPTAVDIMASPPTHAWSNLPPTEDKKPARSTNGALAAEKAINQILQNRLKSICRGC